MFLGAKPISHAEEMAERIRSGDGPERLRLQPEFGQLLHQMDKDGTDIPARLRNLHEQLLEEAIQAKFDNLPM